MDDRKRKGSPSGNFVTAIGHSIYGKPLILSNWHFVFGFPTSKSEYKNSRYYGEFTFNKEISTFDDYKRVILDPFENFITPIRDVFGLKVTRYASSRQFSSALREDSAVILFTHSSRGCFEFSDGMVPFEAIIGRISKNFHGILDIVACNPAGFPALLSRRFPDAAVRWVPMLLSAEGWLLYCATFLSQFESGPMSYMEATLRTAALHLQWNPAAAMNQPDRLV